MRDQTAHGGKRRTDGRHRVGPRRAGSSHVKWESKPRNGASSRAAFAAVDLGTNNCRLLIAEPRDQSFRVIDAFSRIVRLGEGLGARGALSEAAMARAISGLLVCASKMRRRRVSRARCVATDACRRAANCDEFIARVVRETGIELEIISSREEAQLVLAGSQPLLDPDVPWALLFDIGGGSTELVWMRLDVFPNEMVGWISLPHGVVSLAERHGGGEFSPGQYEALVQKIAGELGPFESANDINRRIREGGVQMIGTSGTVTTLSGVHLGLEKYDRQRVDGLWLSFADARAAAERLRAMKPEQRAAHPCIGQDRADLVVAGCAILEAIRRTWPTERLRVADRGVREGLLLSLMSRDRPRPATAAAGPGQNDPAP